MVQSGLSGLATKYVLGVQYDGTNFRGWQRQSNQVTVQGLLEEAIGRVANHPVTITSAGRTDAGVHATGQVVAFTSSADRQCVDWLRGVNALTPNSVTVNWVRETSEAFHPRFSATARRYLFVYFDGAQNPFAHQFAWAVPPLDADAMHRQAQVLVGEHNFTSFRAAGCQSATAMRRVNRCDVRRLGAYVVLDIEANAFLLHMVRNIARVLMDLGCGRTDMSLETLINNRDRSQVGATAPPHGLYLYHVSYPTESFPQPHVPPILAAAVGPT